MYSLARRVYSKGTVRNASRQAISPGIPLPEYSASKRRSDFLAVNLPSASQPSSVAAVQVPYVPDFWNSARSPEPDVPFQSDLPKLHVVAGSVTHYGGGPTHNLETLQEDSSPSATVQARNLPLSNDLGFWADFWETLGLSRSFSVRRSLSEAGSLAKDESQIYSRPLTDDERKGLYVLLGIVGGSWLVGALASAVAEKDGTQTQH